MWSEFKEFISRGNVFELAIAVIIGASFNNIVNSLVEDMIMPIIGIIVGGVNLEALYFRVGGAFVFYGKFIQSMMDFLLVSVAIFTVIKIFNRYGRRKEKKEYKVKAITNLELLTEIRDILKRQEQIGKDVKPEETIIRLRRKVK
ncbi:large conductance mechanosensitive channel protein MscL [Bacillus sp. RO1]|uniref:large conductance mechanosensitive channel protein MscL n=1 Tax=Bacillus sp. RO1 TaxID=2722703 RepID=UPI001456B6C5|nr:large conductance mechanosensitive channel protein MscL [Bacillus sp. RO1]NLP52924.1 large conductance mechanosensitive channel protein MscL [Bacillus sp. RO1]